MRKETSLSLLNIDDGDNNDSEGDEDDVGNGDDGIQMISDAKSWLY